MKRETQKDHPDGFAISEKKARAQLGVTRDDIRALRNKHLTEGTHYARGKQQSVWLNEAGLTQLLASAAPHETLTHNRAVVAIRTFSTPLKRNC